MLFSLKFEFQRSSVRKMDGNSQLSEGRIGLHMYVVISPQTNLDISPESEPALELHTKCEGTSPLSRY